MRVTRKSSTAGLVHPQHRLARNVAAPSRLPLAELSMVRLSGDLTLDDGRTLPAGATGAVVFVHAAGEAYEVEFITPFHAVATVMAPNLSQAA